jgi:hypothetical protein
MGEIRNECGVSEVLTGRGHLEDIDLRCSCGY